MWFVDICWFKVKCLMYNDVGCGGEIWGVDGMFMRYLCLVYVFLGDVKFMIMVWCLVCFKGFEWIIYM